MSIEADSNRAAQSWREVKHSLPQEVCDKLIGMAKEANGVEICGFILADQTIASIDNVDANPSKGFSMEQSQMIAVIKGKKGIVATYHSHPSGRKWPSTEDTDHMMFLYKQGCPWQYIIVTTDGVFEFEPSGL